MSRFFNGADKIVFGSVASAANVNGAFTMLVVWRITTATDTSWQSAIETHTSAAAPSVSMGRRQDATLGHLYVSNATLATGTDTGLDNTIENADNWTVCAAGKAAGSSAPFNHKVVIGGASTRFTNSFGMPDAPSITGGTIVLGGDDDPLTGRIAAAAIFNKVLSQAEVEGIASAKTTQSIYALGPVWLVDDNDAFVADYMGNSGNGTKTNTADDADDPSGWVYGVGGDINVTGVSAQATAAGNVPTVSTLTRPYILSTIS